MTIDSSPVLTVKNWQPIIGQAVADLPEDLQKMVRRRNGTTWLALYVAPNTASSPDSELIIYRHCRTVAEFEDFAAVDPSRDAMPEALPAELQKQIGWLHPLIHTIEPSPASRDAVHARKTARFFNLRIMLPTCKNRPVFSHFEPARKLAFSSWRRSTKFTFSENGLARLWGLAGIGKRQLRRELGHVSVCALNDGG
jgi:hypothetical protein